MNLKRRECIEKLLLERVPNAKIFDVYEVESDYRQRSIIAYVKFDKTVVNPNRYFYKELLLARPHDESPNSSEESYSYVLRDIILEPQWHVFMDPRHWDTSMYIPPSAKDEDVLALIDYIYEHVPFKNVRQAPLKGVDTVPPRTIDVSIRQIFQEMPRLGIRRDGPMHYELQLSRLWVVLV